MSERWNEMDDVDLMQMEAEMRDELQDLREAATVYADRAWARGTVAVARPAMRRAWLAWAAAGAAATVLTVGGVRVSRHTALEAPVSKATAVQVRPASPVSDEALLQQIQSDITSGVPAAMEPLQASDALGARDAVKR